jgi:2-haloalkanoic acid dehalogenase type II
VPRLRQSRGNFSGSGPELSNAWRTRQFEYTWLRTLGGHYADFWQVTEESLVYAAKALGVDPSAGQRDRLMQSYLGLKAWPDVAPALKELKAAGIRMAFLSNFTDAMLDAAVKNSGLEGFFEPHLSTDKVKAFKPDPRAYRMGLDAFKLKKDEIVFAAFAGWDAAGAKWVRVPYVLGQPPEHAGRGVERRAGRNWLRSRRSREICARLNEHWADLKGHVSAKRELRTEHYFKARRLSRGDFPDSALRTN